MGVFMSLLPSLLTSRHRNYPQAWTDVDDIFDTFNDMLSRFKTDVALNGRTFALDVEEQEDRYVIEAEMPGAEKKNVDVTLQDHLLTIKLNEKGESEKKARSFVRKERWEGSASRSITLPLSADSDMVDATLKDGMLKVVVKKMPASKTKKIAVQ